MWKYMQVKQACLILSIRCVNFKQFLTTLNFDKQELSHFDGLLQYSHIREYNIATKYIK